jgi:hypothetical protein
MRFKGVPVLLLKNWFIITDNIFGFNTSQQITYDLESSEPTNANFNAPAPMPSTVAETMSKRMGGKYNKKRTHCRKRMQGKATRRRR